MISSFDSSPHGSGSIFPSGHVSVSPGQMMMGMMFRSLLKRALSGQTTEKVVWPDKGIFLYPTLRQFDFDEVCELIVRSLEKRNWQVPGLTVEFRHYGQGEEKLCYVGSIVGNDFKIEFGRNQGKIPGCYHNDVAAACVIAIPKHEVHVSADGYPRYYRYCGPSYRRDREKFLHGYKSDRDKPNLWHYYTGSEQSGEQKTYAYRVSHWPLPQYFINQSAKTFWGCIKAGIRQPYFRAGTVMVMIKDYLLKKVLPLILAQPETTERRDHFATDPAIPCPADFMPLYCLVDADDYHRIVDGQKDPSQIPPYRRYAIEGCDCRLVMPHVRSRKGRRYASSEFARESFFYCGVGDMENNPPVRQRPEDVRCGRQSRFPDNIVRPKLPDFNHSDRTYLMTVKPTRLNDIYIVDHEPYERLGAEFVKAGEAQGKNSFTPDEIDQFNWARADTMVPIHQYKGGFKKPLVLVHRTLGFDEVQFIREVPSYCD